MLGRLADLPVRAEFIFIPAGRRSVEFHPSLLASLYVRSNDPLSALAVLRGSRRLVAPDRFLYRSLLISTGDVAGFLADLRSGLHEEFLADTGNQVMGRWRALVDGPWMRSPDPLGSLEHAVELTAALVGVGYLEFADRIATRSLLIHAPRASGDDASVLSDRLRQAQSDLRLEIAFESSMRRILNEAYRPPNKARQPSLDEVLEQLRQASLKILGRDVVGSPRKFTLPFVGVLVDSLGGGLPAHLARFNKHLVLGQRNGAGVEAMVLTRLSVRHVDPVPGLRDGHVAGALHTGRG